MPNVILYTPLISDLVNMFDVWDLGIGAAAALRYFSKINLMRITVQRSD
jgi:hypothetical protein